MNKFSLRYQLVLPFVFLVLIVPATVGWMLFDAGSTSVNSLTRRVLTDIAFRINSATEQHLNSAISMLETFAPEKVPGQASPPSFSTEIPWLEERIWSISSLNSQPNTYVYFGGEDGRFVGVYRINSYLYELYRREPGAMHRRVYALSHPRDRSAVLRDDDFDPRTRPWYALAAQQEQPVWSPVYNDFTSKKPTITVAKAVRNAGGALSGVAAVDVELKALSDYLEGLTISKNGLAFVMDSAGFVIASTGSQPPFIMQGGKQQRLRFSEMNSTLISAAGAKALEWKKYASRTKEPLSVAVDLPDGTMEITAIALDGKHGLDWITVVAAPQSDFMAGVTRSFNRSIGFAVACIILALLVGMGIINRILRDIFLLNTAAHQIGIGEPVSNLDIHRKDEIGQLARTFNEMEHNLRTDRLTGAYNREFLFTRIRFIKNQADDQALAPGFALLFIDMDDFKLINDRFGHDAGDRLLVTVVERLKAATRSSDIVVRYGGDEFVVLLNDVSTPDQVVSITDKIRAIVGQPLQLGQEEVQPCLSVGWALYPEDGEDAEILLRTADARMFDAKKVFKTTQAPAKPVSETLQ